MSTVANYFQGIFDPAAIPQQLKDGTRADSDLEDTLKVPEAAAGGKDSRGDSVVPALEASGRKGEAATVAAKPLPKLKCQISISNFRVAIIEDVYTKQPQALSLNVCRCVESIYECYL